MQSARRANLRVFNTVFVVLLGIALLWYLIKIYQDRNFTPSILLQFVLSGLSTGSIYALVALGFVVIHNVTGIINLAQGEFVMLGGMIAIELHKEAQLPLLAAAVLSVLAVILIGALMERLTIHPARHSSIVTLVIITIGFAFATKGISLLAWGTDPYKLPAFSKGPPLDVFGATLTHKQLWIVGVTALILVGLYFLFERTLLGKALRACAVNRTAARLMGISPERMSLFAFALSAGLGAIGGVVFAPATYITYDMGPPLSVWGFVAAIMGGLVSSPGAVIGGLIMGVLESLGKGFTVAGLGDAIALLVLFLILFFRPSGIFGAGETGREGL